MTTNNNDPFEPDEYIDPLNPKPDDEPESTERTERYSGAESYAEKIEREAEEGGPYVASDPSQSTGFVPDPEDAEGTRRNKWVIPVIVLLLLLLSGVVIWSIFGGNDNETVETARTVPVAPDTVDNSVSLNTACDVFVEAGLVCNVSEEPHEELERGTFISQTPKSGEEVSADTTIELVYSAGPPESVMPELRNEEVETAEEILYDLGLNVAEEHEIVSGTGVNENLVVSTDVESGETVENGTTVALQVSDGTVEIPNWVGENREQVSTDTDELSVQVEYIEEESDEARGTVLDQSPEGGENHPLDMPVEVTVAAPFENIELDVPDVLEMSPEDAQSALAEAGFRQISSVNVETTEVDEPIVTQVVPGSKGMSEELIVIVVSEPTD